MIEQFVVKHYVGEKWPTVKGNQFDGLEFRSTREEAEAFVNWINARLTELNLDVDAFNAKDPLNVMYTAAMRLSQDGAHDNLTKRLRYYVMQQLVAQAIAFNPFADVVECGCWHGHSTLLIEAAMLRESNEPRLHVFDSFEGLSPPAPEDGAVPVHNFKSDLQALQSKVSNRTHLHRGWIPNVFAHAPDPMFISFASIDVDLYEPTRDALAFVYPRLVSGGTIYFDDYGYKAFPGAKLAIDQFIAEHPPAMFIKLATGSAFMVKA